MITLTHVLLTTLLAFVLTSGLALAQPPAAAIQARPGVDVLLETPSLLQGRRIGLVTHAAGLTSSGDTTWNTLLRDSRFTVAALFAPEHGLAGTIPAGQLVPDTNARVPVYSLYGATRQPTPAMMNAIDVFVVDLQDVGARAYTYVSTMAMVMQAARDAGKPVVVLDRPNPQGGLQVDGPVLDPAFRSFIGMFPIPMVHGMTIGELAWMFNSSFDLNTNLTIVPMRGWTRRMVWEETGLPWVRPSPNIATMVTPFHYAATGVLDGTNLSNGAGGAGPFEVVVSPWLDGRRLAKRLNTINLPGVSFEPFAAMRASGFVSGVRLVVTDPLRFRPATTAIYVLTEVRNLHPRRLQFVPRNGRHIFDFVWGTDKIRKDIVRGAPAAAIVARWEPNMRGFLALRSAYLLYP